MTDIQPDAADRAVPRWAFTPAEAAECLGVARTRIFQAIKDSQLTAIKQGKATIIELEELKRWLRSLPTRGRKPDYSQDVA